METRRRITQQPATISICFAWRDGVQAKVRTYVRHRVFQFYWNAGASAGDIKMLLPLSPDGRWNRLLPIPLQQIVLDKFHAFTALREETGMQEQSEPKSEAGEATELEEQYNATLEALGAVTSGLPLLSDPGLDTIEEF